MEHIEPLIPIALNDLAKKNIGKLQHQLIALRRIRKKMEDYLDDFVAFLKKVQLQDPELFICSSCRAYLVEKTGDNFLTDLVRFLEKNGYDENGLSRIQSNKQYNEMAFLNRLPKDNINVLWLCIFYLYKPRFTQRFFWEKLNYLSIEEEKLINDYRSFPDNLQNKVSESLSEIAKKNTRLIFGWRRSDLGQRARIKKRRKPLYFLRLRRFSFYPFFKIL